MVCRKTAGEAWTPRTEFGVNAVVAPRIELMGDQPRGLFYTLIDEKIDVVEGHYAADGSVASKEKFVINARPVSPF
jgi:hypothetical protein